jgi:glycine/D-amino acid oxidase-like deaminating enzyme
MFAGKPSFVRPSLRNGFPPEVLSGERLREREPAIKDRVVGGMFNPEAATVNPYEFGIEMQRRAERRGAKFQTATRVLAFAWRGRLHSRRSGAER